MAKTWYETRTIHLEEEDKEFKAEFKLRYSAMQPNWGGLPQPAEFEKELNEIHEVGSDREPTEEEMEKLWPLIESDMEEL